MSTFVYKGGRGGQESQKNGYIVCVRPLKHIANFLVKFSKLHYSEGIVRSHTVKGSAVLLRLAKNRNVGQFLIVELINRKTMCLLLLLGIYDTMHSALKC